jgi:NodT family efflux transporter outer membrane factor (OMF) lipoprotein
MRKVRKNNLTQPGCLLLVFFFFLLSGCMAGKDYVAPDLGAQMADVWNAATETGGVLDAGQPPEMYWWRQFEDETLTGLVEQLAGSNLALAEARERIVEAQARRGIVGADSKIQVAASAGYTHTGAGDEAVSFQGPPAGASADLLSLGAAASWELDLWGRTQHLVAAADADIEAGYADYRSMRVSLSAELSLAYIDLRTLQARLNTIKENIALQEKTLDLAETRHESGVGSALEVVQTKRLLRSSRAHVPELEQGITASENRINVLLGKRPGETRLQPGEMPSVPELIGMGIPVDLMTRRPDISSAALRYQAAVARTGAAEADKYPRLSLSGALNLQSDALDGLIDPDALVYSLGPDLYFPLFTGGRIESSIQQRASQAEQARLALARKLIEALSEVETAATGVVRTQEKVLELRAAESSARESVVLAQSLFDADLGDLFQVLDAQKQLVSIQESLLLSRQGALAEVVHLYRALGGGWEDGGPMDEG